MNVLDTTRARLLPTSGEDRQVVREELAHVLKSRHFTSSKRYPALLTYVVEEALAGRSAELKERTLGIEVFNRPPDYDTISDTVVRVTAGEVRKRLALVYHESDFERGIQINLPVGSYVPEFLRLAQDEAPTSPTLAPGRPLAEEPPLPAMPFSSPASLAPMPATSGSSFRPRQIAVAVLSIVTLASVAYIAKVSRPSAIDLFWQPVFASNTPVLLCAGSLVASDQPPYGMTMATRKDDYPYTSMSTTISMVTLANLVSQSHKEYLVQPTSSTTLADMREHPVVLLGAYNNEWTPRLQEELPYRFATGPERQIFNAANPANVWVRPATLPIRDEDDYAIIARFRSRLTGNIVLLIAGIGKNGTEAATQFVTSPRSMEVLRQQSKDWESKNIELVLKTKVINGKNGALSVEAARVW